MSSTAPEPQPATGDRKEIARRTMDARVKLVAMVANHEVVDRRVRRVTLAR